MFHTAEIRWFIKGAPDASIEQWFDASSLAREEDPRIDAYLLLPGCTTCGAKIRQGHFEIKAQTSPPEPVSYGNGIAGQRAAWVKWSSGLAGAQLLKEQQGPETWVHVEKSRKLRLFALSDGIDEKPAGEWQPGPGCFVELAALRLQGDSEDWQDAATWWSVCFEAFGPQHDVIDLLDRAASSSLPEPWADRLGPGASMSYPQWLALNGRE